MAIARGMLSLSSARVMTGSTKPQLKWSASPKMLVKILFVLGITSVITNNDVSRNSGRVINVAVAFQNPPPQHNGGNLYKYYKQQQQYPEGSKILEPNQTEFPKTSTPDSGKVRQGGMFSPMDQNDPKKREQVQNVRSIWETSAPMLVEASSLHTVDFENPAVERVQVLLKKSDMDPVSGKRKTTREPLIARVDLWHGPDSTPQNLAIYLEDDDEDEITNIHDEENEDHFHGENHRSSDCDTPFSTIIETPHGYNTIAIRNIAENSDLLSCVEGEENEDWYKPSSLDINHSPLQSVVQRLKATTIPQRIDSTTARKSEDVNDEEGNKAVIGSCTVELPSKVTSVQVLLQTDFMQPIQARIELELRMIDSASSSGSRVVKRTIVEVYSEDGMHRPFFAILETPRKKGQNTEQGWHANNRNVSYSASMKVVNLSTTEFPLLATVDPHTIDDSLVNDDMGEVSSSQRHHEVEEDDTHHVWSHIGGGSNYNMNSNSTILDAEIL